MKEIDRSNRLTKAWYPLKYHDKQNAAYRSTARFINLPCGRGSGKTELARRRIIRALPVRVPQATNPIYFYALPVRDQAKRVAWDHLKSLVPKTWLAKPPSETELTISTIFGSTLYLVGLDKPQRIEGNQWCGGVIDESCDVKPGTFGRSILPALSWHRGWVWRIGVPKRQGVGAREFKEFCKLGYNFETLPGTDDRIETYKWRSDEIIPEEKLAFAKTTLDFRDYNEQYNAEWEQLGGLIFYAFNRESNVSDRVKYIPQLPIAVSCDFNVNPMSWVIGHIINDKQFMVFDELFIRDTNTPNCLDILYDRYGSHEAGWLFFGDATGKARKTSASFSDYAHIYNDTRFDKKLYVPESNPPQSDRFASTNKLLMDAAGNVNCLIHPRCVHLIQDLEERGYKQDSNEPDDSGDLGHMTDAFGYIIHQVWPIAIEQVSESKAQVESRLLASW